MKQGEFRKDLYYRLKKHEIVVPPLRTRKKDLPLLIDHFAKKMNPGFDNESLETLKKMLLDILSNYDFQGNIRELESMVDDAVKRNKKGPISKEYLIKAWGINAIPNSEHRNDTENNLYPDYQDDDLRKFFKDIKQDYEYKRKAIVEEAMRRKGGNVSAVAELLDMSRNAIRNLLKKKG